MTFVITPALLSACSLGRNSGWPGCRAHSDPGAGQFGTDFRIEHSLAGWQAFRDQVKAYPALAVALETNQGTAVDQLLRLDGTIYPVNPLSAKSYRERKAPSGHKTDRLDAEGVEKAVGRYAGQLEIYRQALARLTGVGLGQIRCALVLTALRVVVPVKAAGAD